MGKSVYYTIGHVWDARNIVVRSFSKGPKDYKDYDETKGLSFAIESDNNYFYKDRKIIKTEIIKLPPSKRVIISKSTGKDYYFIFQSTTNPTMYELAECYKYGTQITSVEEKYKKLFIIYEELERNPDLNLRAIRHSLSHTRSRLTKPNVVAALYALFGDTKIDLKRYKHRRVFKQHFNILATAAFNLFITEVAKYTKDTRKLGRYYIS